MLVVALHARRHVGADVRYLGERGHGQAPALGEVVLNVNDDECGRHSPASAGPVRQFHEGASARLRWQCTAFLRLGLRCLEFPWLGAP